MKKLLVLALFVLSLIGCGTPPPRHQLKEAALRIELVDLGVCSGTAIGPHAVLTATHCFEQAAPIKINDKLVTVSKRVDDDRDHTIIIVNVTFDYWAPLGATAEQGDKVTIYGNPAGKRDWMRVGIVAGYDQDDFGNALQVYDINGFFGDSGSGVFNSRGELVAVIGVVIFEDSQGVPLKLMGAYAFHFTPQQWAEANA